MTAPGPDRPVLTVVRGLPTPEELAAVVAVLLSRPTAAPPAAPPVRSRWAAAAGLRAPVHAGPYAWRASGDPR